MRTLTALIFDGFEILDLMGPLEFIGNLPEDFTIKLVAETPGPVHTHAPGVDVMAHCALPDEDDDIGVLFIPGGQGTRREVTNQELIKWISAASTRAEVVLTVCTGAALLAATGLLDGKKATTNKRAFDWIAATRPAVHWQNDARWVEEDKYFTSSGVSAGMDMTLAVLAKLFGKARAEEVAMWAEYTWNDDPSADPFAIR